MRTAASSAAVIEVTAARAASARNYDRMRRITHLTLGAAVAVPIAASLSPGIAAGCLWWGVVGGGFPDWLDRRSDLRKPLRLRHRGASHGLLVAALATLAVFGVLMLLTGSTFAPFGASLAVPDAAVWPWTLSFLLGVLSHLVSDACTISGIRPLLPFSRLQFWTLPRFLRCRHDGYLDRFLRLGGLAVIAVGVVAYLAPLLT
ncbi:MAG: metal-dependent hydrolase [Thermomicrobiales bacterium]